MEIQNFKVTAQTEHRIDFTCEGKGRLVEWNAIEGYSSGPLEDRLWPAEWVVIVQRGGKQIKRKMKLSQRSKAITSAINEQVALWVARKGARSSGPLEDSKDWPANSKDKVAGSGPQSGPQGPSKGPSKVVARTVALPDIHKMDIQPGPRHTSKKDSLEIPEFLRR